MSKLKSLSLKKKPGQCSITTFFKNVSEKSSKSHDTDASSAPKKTYKRKANSPIDSDNAKISSIKSEEDRVPLIKISDSPSYERDKESAYFSQIEEIDLTELTPPTKSNDCHQNEVRKSPRISVKKNANEVNKSTLRPETKLSLIEEDTNTTKKFNTDEVFSRNNEKVEYFCTPIKQIVLRSDSATKTMKHEFKSKENLAVTPEKYGIFLEKNNTPCKTIELSSKLSINKGKSPNKNSTEKQNLTLFTDISLSKENSSPPIKYMSLNEQEKTLKLKLSPIKRNIAQTKTVSPLKQHNTPKIKKSPIEQQITPKRKVPPAKSMLTPKQLISPLKLYKSPEKRSLHTEKLMFSERTKSPLKLQAAENNTSHTIDECTTPKENNAPIKQSHYPQTKTSPAKQNRSPSKKNSPIKNKLSKIEQPNKNATLRRSPRKLINSNESQLSLTERQINKNDSPNKQKGVETQHNEIGSKHSTIVNNEIGTKHNKLAIEISEIEIKHREFGTKDNKIAADKIEIRIKDNDIGIKHNKIGTYDNAIEIKCSEFRTNADKVGTENNDIGIKYNNNVINENVSNDCIEKKTEENEIDLMFEDDWTIDAVIEEISESEELDLSTFKRCDIISIERKSDLYSKLKLKGNDGRMATCQLEGIWNTLALKAGDIVSVQATKDITWKVTDLSGFIVLRPDVLLSSTTVVGAVFCKRKAVLQERFRGLDCANKAMTVGILIHELLQTALHRQLTTVAQVQNAAEELLSSPPTVRLLYDAEMSMAEGRHDIGAFVPQVVRFVDEIVVHPISHSNKAKKADEWSGRIEKILDIEENIVAPQLGLKGKIDVTLQVKIHEKGCDSTLIPLELKTGRASVSAEHRGQLILYTMMMSIFRGNVSQGLLLYLKDIVTLKVVKSGYPEQRDLIMLRNQLVQYLSPNKTNKTNKELRKASIDSCGGMSRELDSLELPEPINHHACANCGYLTLCSLFQWHTESPPLSENNHLLKLRDGALGHLNDLDIEYFLRWTGLLLLEDLEKSLHNPLHHIWTVPPHAREERGRCLTDLQVADVTEANDKYIHTFVRPSRSVLEGEQKEGSGLRAGDYVIVSTETRIWIAAGPITQIDADVVCIALERDLKHRNSLETRYCIDTYESQSQLGFNLTNLGALMDNVEKANHLRRLIVSGCEAEFSARLPREVGRVGARLLKSLNLLQQRAVLKVVAAKDYVLIHGMPGTGKTQTVAVLIQMLVALGQKVLVTAHTHSAVDNVLQRLPGDMRILRLGSAARVSPRLARFSEAALTQHCVTPEQLRHVYSTADVVGVTCLGASHSILTKHRFDVCIVDESTQVLQATVLRALMSADKFVLVGDPEQLPPLVHSDHARKLGLDECLFSRLRSKCEQATMSLSAQYRMNTRVTALANLFTYEGKLTCANDVVRNGCVPISEQKSKLYSTIPWLAECLSPKLYKSVLLLDTGCTTKYRGDTPIGGEKKILASNEAEALVVLAIVKAFIQAGVSAEDIGVITPYRDQVSLLNKCIMKLQSSLSPGRRRSPRKLNDVTQQFVEVNTVDQYQGRDKSVIIYSCCKSWDPEKGDYNVKDSEILEDKRRLTVAVTRAKHKLILVADVRTLRHYSTFSYLFQCLKKLDKEHNISSEITVDSFYNLLKEELGMFL